MVQQRRKYLRTRQDIRRRLEEQKLAKRQHEVKDKRQREQRERQTRTMANIADLEIPGELAYVYNKLDDWQPVHDGKNIITAVGEVQPMDMGYRLPVDINSHPFSKYTSVYFKNPQWGVRTEPLSTSLTTLHGEQQTQHALAIFKLIVRFMCENTMSEKREKALADYIIQMGVREEGVRDEILCQVVNQTWQNQNGEQAERLWRLMACCLSAFMPSSPLFKYLLKYVSDVAVNGYKWVCQHKVLQSANLRPQLSRSYPPCFLEWRCIQRKAHMAVEVKFPDDINKTGHVESWTSGELLASYLLKQRGIQDNIQGWTLVLQDDVEYYELMGYDYVLDLLSEMEIAPGFPHSTAYFLVSVDRSQERGHHKKHAEPHNAERERVLKLPGPLPQMLKRTTPVVSADQGLSARPRGDSFESSGNSDFGFSTTSILNQRPTEILDVELSDSRMNQRYNKRRAAPNGHVHDGTLGAASMNGDGFTFEDNGADIDLSQTRLNGRYFPDKTLNSEVEYLSPTSKLNARYAKKLPSTTSAGTGRSTAQDQIRKKQSPGSADAMSVASAQSDWSHWVEDVFNDALDEHDDGVSEGRSLHSRIKGGGKGVPGVQTQQTNVPPNLNLGVGLTTPALSVAPPVISPAFAFNTQLTPGLQPQPDPLQQLVNQQALQQQAAQQAAFQSLLLQNQQRQQQQTLLHTLTQQQQQQQQNPLVAQVAATQMALQQTELENKLLKQSIERENLRKQLLQLQQSAGSPPARTQGQTAPSAAAAQLFSSLDTSYSSAGLAIPPGVLPSPQQEQQMPVFSTNGATAGASAGDSGATAKRVSILKATFDSQQADQETAHRAVSFASPSEAQGDRNEVFSYPEPVSSPPRGQRLPASASPPPPPPPPELSSPPLDESSDDIYTDGFSMVPPLRTQPDTPFPPPPPPPPPPVSSTPSGLEIDREKGTFTIRDKNGVSRTVRIGKVVWPPPSEEAHKKEVNVGKLEINENLAKGIENQMVGKKKWQKPPAPEPEEQPKSILRKDSEGGPKQSQRGKLTESSAHSAAMQLLESKLGGAASPAKKTQEASSSSSTASSSASSRPLPPLPPASQTPSRTSESISVQTTDTLRRMNFVVPELKEEEEEEGVGEGDEIYASAIIRDEPPPRPRQAKKPEAKQGRRHDETYESVVQPDLPPAREEFQRHVEPDVVTSPKSPPPARQIDYAAFERVVTELFPQNAKHFLMYNKVPWVLHVRKEVFWPSERVENLTVRHLLYCQVVHDVYNNACVRLTRDQRVKMKSMLEGYGINHSNYLSKELNGQMKKIIIDTAKEWPLYFCRLFPVASDGEYSGVRYLGVSHSGLRLVTREKSLVDDYLSVVEDIRFEDVVDVMLPNDVTVQLNLRSKSVLFHTHRALQLKDMVDRFCQESEKGNKHVVAVKDYRTRESTLLSFKEGDIIKLVDPEMTVQKDWLYGSLNGIVGLFPEQYVRPLARHEVETTNMKPKLYLPSQSSHSPLHTTREEVVSGTDNVSVSSHTTFVTDGKFSMMEFALLHFRESMDKPNYLPKNAPSGNGGDWSWKEQADMVKWTQSPIQASLLKLPTSDMNKLALECFLAIMRFMEDYPMGSDQTDYDCVMKILRSCHKYTELRDEVYCQLCKQTTNNRSMKGRSKVKGWRLLALIAAYCDCSDTLHPYLFKYLETTATDVNRTYNHAAVLCLQNLRKTFKFGGRKNIPLRDEVQALADGRNCRRFPFFYSGSQVQSGLLQVRSCTVVQDCIADACADLNIQDPVEMEEYAFFVRSGEGVFSRVGPEEYVLDVTAEFMRKKTHYDLIFQRTVWMFPLNHLDSDVYVDMMFYQCIFDYMDGLMLVRPEGEPTPQTLEDMVLIAALLHKANNFVGLPTLKQLEVMVPKTVRQGPTLRPQQWLNRIQEKQREVASHTALSAKAHFLDTLSKWPLFGSSFFLIKSIPSMTGECMLVVNKQGISFLRRDTHEILLSHPLREVLSTRRYNSEAGGSFLDMKIGNLMVQKILRIETDQGFEISNLLGQYMQIINHQHTLTEQP